MEFINFFEGWLLGILTNALLNDNDAIAKCRIDLLDLEKELETLRRKSQYGTDINFDIKQIEKIKDIIKLLNIHCAGLLIKNNELRRCIDESLVLIYQKEDDPMSPQNMPSSIGVMLGNIWADFDPDRRKYRATKIKRIENFLHSGILKRSFLRLLEYSPYSICFWKR